MEALVDPRAGGEPGFSDRCSLLPFVEATSASVAKGSSGPPAVLPLWTVDVAQRHAAGAVATLAAMIAGPLSVRVGRGCRLTAQWPRGRLSGRFDGHLVLVKLQ